MTARVSSVGAKRARLVGLDLGEILCERLGWLRALELGWSWISRGDTFAKILRWQKMLHIPGREEAVTVLAETGGLQGFWNV